jgi:phosphorylcholine metabolism protein LicD
MIYILDIFKIKMTKEKYSIQMSNKLSISDIKNISLGHEKMTEMLRWFDKVCRENDLKYWVTGGTLIGTIRHEGWIPWDGDLDVGMYNQDLMKLEKIIDNELPANLKYYKANEWSNTQGVIHTKLKDLYSHYYDGNETGGLCLDIFPYINQNNNIIPFNNGWAPICGIPDGFSRNVNDIFPLKECIFENIKVFVPNKYKDISKTLWGDFPPKLPPIDERYPHEGKINPFLPRPHNL